jgi:hypothetical protein
MSGALREVLALFSIQVDDKQLAAADKKVEGFIGTLAKLGPIIADAFAIGVVKNFFDAQIDGAAHLEDLSEKLGISTDALTHFQYAARMVGVDADGAAMTLGFLNKTVGQSLEGNKAAAEAFTKLGVHVKDTHGKVKPLDDILADTADGLAKLGSQQERAGYAVKLFGRSGQVLLPILSQGSAKIKELYGEADSLGIILGGDFYKNAKLARNEIAKFSMVTDALKARILNAALPAITSMFEWFVKISRPVMEAVSNSNALQHALELLAVVAGIKLLGSLKTLFTFLGGFKNLGIVAAITVLYVAFDDVKTMLEGGNSALGVFLDKLGGLGTHERVVKAIRDAWGEWSGKIGDVIKGIADFLGSDTGGVNDKLAAMGAAFVLATGYLVAMTASALVAAAPWVALAAAIASVTFAITEWSKVGGAVSSILEQGASNHLNNKEGKTDEELDKETFDLKRKRIHDREAGLLPPSITTIPAGVTGVGPGNGTGIFGNGPSVSLPFTGNTMGTDKRFQPSGAPSGTLGEGDAANVVNHFNVTVTAGKNPEETGKKIAQATATEAQKFNYNTFLAGLRP